MRDNTKELDYILDDFLNEVRHIDEGANLGEYESYAAEQADLNNAITETIKKIQALITEQTRKAEQVDRIEVIDETGRVYVKGSIYGTPVKVELDYQDEGRTLKVFVEALKPHHKAEE